MAGLADSGRTLPAEGLAALCAAVLPGASVAAPRRLAGGVSSDMYVLDLTAPSGAHERLVLRRYGAWRRAQDPGVCQREWRTLALVERLGIPAPRPVWRDPDGHLFGGPTLVTTFLPGRAVLTPRDVPRWAGQLARMLATLHGAPLGGQDVSFLPDAYAATAAAVAPERPDASWAGHPDGAALWAAMRARWPRVGHGRRALLHGDYWSGNVLWQRGRVAGVVDWEAPCVGPPALDVAVCRLDMAILAGPAAAAAFLRAYERAAGRPVDDLDFWDLAAAASALPDPARWLPAFHGHGRADLTPEVLRGRVRAFIAATLG